MSDVNQIISFTTFFFLLYLTYFQFYIVLVLYCNDYAAHLSCNTRISSIRTSNTADKITRLSIVGNAVPCCHLYIACGASKPNASCSSLTDICFCFLNIIMFSPLAIRFNPSFLPYYTIYDLQCHYTRSIKSVYLKSTHFRKTSLLFLTYLIIVFKHNPDAILFTFHMIMSCIPF